MNARLSWISIFLTMVMLLTACGLATEQTPTPTPVPTTVIEDATVYAGKNVRLIAFDEETRTATMIIEGQEHQIRADAIEYSDRTIDADGLSWIWETNIHTSNTDLDIAGELKFGAQFGEMYEYDDGDIILSILTDTSPTLADTEVTNAWQTFIAGATDTRYTLHLNPVWTTRYDGDPRMKCDFMRMVSRQQLGQETAIPRYCRSTDMTYTSVWTFRVDPEKFHSDVIRPKHLTCGNFSDRYVITRIAEADNDPDQMVWFHRPYGVWLYDRQDGGHYYFILPGHVNVLWVEPELSDWVDPEGVTYRIFETCDLKQ